MKTCTEKKTMLERVIKSLDGEGSDNHLTNDFEEGDKEEEDDAIGDNSEDDTNTSADI